MGSNIVKKIGIASLAATGVAVLGWGISKLLYSTQQTPQDPPLSQPRVAADGGKEIARVNPTDPETTTLKVAAAGATILAWGLLKLVEEQKNRNSLPYKKDLSTLQNQTQIKEQEDQQKRIRDEKWVEINVVEGIYRLNFDGSDRKQVGKAGAGCIIRDGLGNPIVAAAYNISTTQTLMNSIIAETTALRNGLRLARKMKMEQLLVEGDAEQVVRSITIKVKEKSKIFRLVQEIKEEMKGFKKVEIGHIPGKANGVADRLARMGTEIKEDSVWYGRASLPFELGKLVDHDINLISVGGGSSENSSKSASS